MARAVGVVFGLSILFTTNAANNRGTPAENAAIAKVITLICVKENNLSRK